MAGLPAKKWSMSSPWNEVGIHPFHMESIRKIAGSVNTSGKLWFVGSGSGTQAQARRECVSRAEAFKLAKLEHEQGGHWHHDAMKLVLLDHYHSPKLDESIVKAIMDCA